MDGHVLSCTLCSFVIQIRSTKQVHAKALVVKSLIQYFVKICQRGVDEGWINKQTNNRGHLKEGKVHDARPGEEERVGMWVPTHHITGFNFI
jgi:hypothetical protein